MVGPLPSAVYWRRRAVVLGAVLLGVIVLFVSCGGNGDDDKRGSGASSQAPVAPSTSASPEDEPSFGDPPPGAGNPSLPAPEDLQSGGATAGGADPSGGPGTVPGASTGTNGGTGTGTGTGSDTNVNVPVGSICTNAEMSVTPVPATTSLRSGSPVDIQIKIKNVSTRQCSRDIGADLQELYIESGAEKIWSSDTCGTNSGTDLFTFVAGGEKQFQVRWNGNEATKCDSGQAAGPAPGAGQYQVRARLGDKVSDPVALTITG
ncbi:adhesin [Actinoplanes sp. RD1]|uniref:adhesin n=1 Tax=Actinoplanes sp. RD1 TaxID=3064538 RepID=UPI002740D44E|nr:adhesin [Actinoplanes sp. RD1]